MTVIKNLGRHSLPPLRRISSRDSKLQEEVGKWFWDRGVTQEIQLSLLHSKLEEEVGKWLSIAALEFWFCCWGFCYLGFGHSLA
jgi:hypothetical protein